MKGRNKTRFCHRLLLVTGTTRHRSDGWTGLTGPWEGEIKFQRSEIISRRRSFDEETGQ
jgi:hypothetical protein